MLTFIPREIGAYSEKEIEEAGEQLQEAFETQDKEQYSKAMDDLLAAIPDSSLALNSLSWKWVDEERRLCEPARILAEKAYQLEPAPYILDTLAYAELFCDQLDDSVSHFREAMGMGGDASACRLAYALSLRGMPGDATEACHLLIDRLEFDSRDKYAEEAIKTFLSGRAKECPELTEQLQAVLDRPKKDWTQLPWLSTLKESLERSGESDEPVLVFRSNMSGDECFSHPAIWKVLRDSFVLCKPEGEELERVERLYATEWRGFANPVVHLLDSKGECLLSAFDPRDSGKFYWQYLAKFSRRDGRLEKWFVAAPFPSEEGAVLDTVFPPEEGIDLGTSYSTKEGRASWKESHARPFMPMISYGLIGPEHYAAYAYSTFDVPEECQGQFRLGCFEGAKVWLNGKLVLTRPYGSLRMDKAIVPVTLDKGTNEVLVKTKHQYNWSSFAFRITDSAGKALFGD